MNISLKFEPHLSYFMTLKINIKNPISDRFKDTTFDEGLPDHFLAGRVRENREWFLYIDKLKILSKSDLESFAHYLSAEYQKLGFGITVKLENKAIKRTIASLSNDYFNNLAETEGVYHYNSALLGLSDTIIGIRFAEGSALRVSEITLEFINSAPFNVEILRLEKEVEGGIPAFIKLLNDMKYDFSKLIMIQTRWISTEEELNRENNGIFLNEMKFTIKLFDPESAPIIGEFSSDVSPHDVKGNAKFKIIGGNTGKIVEFDIKSKWFHDFYEDVVKPISGPFFYWGYSDGKGNIDSYYIIPERNQVLFLKGLKKHWSEPSRANHKNIILKVENMKEIQDELDFPSSMK